MKKIEELFGIIENAKTSRDKDKALQKVSLLIMERIECTPECFCNISIA